MKNRTDRQIKSEIKRLEKERKTIKKYSLFGHDNWDSIDKSINILQRFIDGDIDEDDFDGLLDDAERQYGENGFMECGEKLAIDFIQGY